jgi:hypothetical protein
MLRLNSRRNEERIKVSRVLKRSPDYVFRG